MEIEKIKKYICLIIIYIFNILPIKGNKIFIFSYYGSQYGCNPKYITNYIQENYPHQFDVVWAFNHPREKNNLNFVRKVRMISLKYFYELCTSKVIITNFRTTDLFVKRKNQYYIQTWHSSLRLKQIEKDAENVLPESYIQMAKKDSQKCDLLLSGCKYSTDIFKKSFWYNGEILEHGTPRNDILFQSCPIKRKEIMKKLKISSNSKVLLYAPTFRKNIDLETYDLKFDNILAQLERKFDGDWVVLVKLHPHLMNKADQLVFGEHVMNVTDFPDIQELIFLADVLLSDYSSLIFDYAITKRPVFLFIPDLEEYTSTERKLYFDIWKLPFVSAATNQDLLEQIVKFDQEDYEEKLHVFLKEIGTFEKGEACKYLLERICQVCNIERRKNLNEAV